MSGLSPLARGTQIQSSSQCSWARFIPAGAGNSRCTRRLCAAITVYPRWRGELIRSVSCTACGCGLSPLARGTPINAALFHLQCRFIPAGAGNSSTPLVIAEIVTVYPRWRGELVPFKQQEQALFGLSPLARGTHLRPPTPHVTARFIPAGAGNSLKVYICS